MRVVQAPNRLQESSSPCPWVFLAGTIEMGTAENWQSHVVTQLKDIEGTIWNPRRDAWDSSWEQRASNPQFREQVEWELNYLEAADQILMYFDPTSKSPVTLLELGLLALVVHGRRQSLTVCCPDGFWRKGNVEFVCERYRIPLVHTFDDFVARIKKELQ